MGVWSALSGLANVTTQENNAARRTKYVKQAKAAQAAGRGSRKVQATSTKKSGK